MSNQVNKSVITATKWSALTEIAAKLVAPISTMFLARLLTPEAFGVLVTATMIISFAEIFTDAGFQKYIIQHSFRDDESLYKSTAVAFWSNLIFSIIVWLGISIFSSQIAYLVGNDGYGLVISISCVCIPLAAFSSIQMALFKRKLDFKTLFIVRIIGIMIPLVITIPLALIIRSYWSLIIGMIALNACNAIILTWKSVWKPKWFYDIKLFKEMFSFTMWSMVEAISIWLTSYVDIFIVGTMLSQHYLGLYRTSISTVGQITSVVTAATTPVLFSSLSRLQNDKEEFFAMFFKFQKMVAIMLIPISMIIFLFSDLITEILLGNQWMETSSFIGMWALTSAVTILLGHYASEVYRSIGKPILSVIAQWLHIIALWPVLLYFVDKGFDTLCIARSGIRMEMVLVQLILLKIYIKISVAKMIVNILPSVVAASSMLLILLFPPTESIFISLVYLIICIVLYVLVLLLFPQERKIFVSLKDLLANKQ